jgi:hypothetical protein
MKLQRAVPILSVLAAGALAPACADIGSPNRSAEAYEWRLFPGIGPGTEDTLSFSWPASRLPVTVWAEDTLGLQDHVEHGLETWEAAFLYGEFDAVLVPDSVGADILVRIGPPISVGFSQAFRSAAPECEGGTTLDLPEDSREIQLPIRVFINPRFDPSTPGVNECLALTTTHELGHAIGIFAHSPVATDLMYSDPTVSVLSERDRSTAELAYHVEPTLTVAPR